VSCPLLPLSEAKTSHCPLSHSIAVIFNCHVTYVQLKAITVVMLQCSRIANHLKPLGCVTGFPQSSWVWISSATFAVKSESTRIQPYCSTEAPFSSPSIQSWLLCTPFGFAINVTKAD
jgi:hypothetical protein